MTEEVKTPEVYIDFCMHRVQYKEVVDYLESECDRLGYHPVVDGLTQGEEMYALLCSGAIVITIKHSLTLVCPGMEMGGYNLSIYYKNKEVRETSYGGPENAIECIRKIVTDINEGVVQWRI